MELKWGLLTGRRKQTGPQCTCAHSVDPAAPGRDLTNPPRLTLRARRDQYECSCAGLDRLAAPRPSVCAPLSEANRLGLGLHACTVQTVPHRSRIVQLACTVWALQHWGGIAPLTLPYLFGQGPVRVQLRGAGQAGGRGQGRRRAGRAPHRRRLGRLHRLPRARGARCCRARTAQRCMRGWLKKQWLCGAGPLAAVMMVFTSSYHRAPWGIP